MSCCRTLDGSLPGEGGDKFRIKIWNKTTGAIVYDNMLGASDEPADAKSAGDFNRRTNWRDKTKNQAEK